MTVETTAATQAMVQFIVDLVRDPALAFQFAQDGQGTIVAQGLTEHDLTGVDMNQAILEACGTPGFPPDAASALQSYVSGGGAPSGGYQPPPPHPGPAPVEHVVQQLQYVNYVTHEGDTTITQTIIDQSTDVNVGGDFLGDIDVDNTAATGAGAVAGGEGDVNAATGDGSQVIDDSTVGQNQNNSDGAVQVGEDNNAPIVTGVNTGVVNDGDIDAPVLANSSNTGIVNDDGTVQDNVLGNNNTTANVDGPNAGTINFGDGEVTNVTGSNLNNSAIGDENATGNNVGPGGVVETGDGSAQSNFQDNDVTETVNANNSNVISEQGDGDQSFQDNDQDNDQNDFDANFPPPLRLEEQPVRTLAEDDEPGAL
jgi:hypothetical protein